MAGLGDMYNDNSMTQYQMMQMANRGRGGSNPLQPALNAVGMYAVMKSQQDMERTKQEMGGLVQRFLMGDPDSGNQIYEYLKNHKDPKFQKIGQNISPDYFNKLLDKSGDDDWFVRASSELSRQGFVPPEMRQKLTEGVMDYQTKVATTRATEDEKRKAKIKELSDPEIQLLDYMKKVRDKKAEYDPQLVQMAVQKAIMESAGSTQAKINIETNPENVGKIAQKEGDIVKAKTKAEQEAKKGRILTTNESQDLGVPYGTTEQQAYGTSVVNKKVQDTLQTLNAAKTVVGQLSPLVDKIFQAKPGVMNVLAQKGKMAYGGLAQDDPDIRLYKSLSKGFLATLARSAGEKGNLNEGDVQRAQELVPIDTDTRQTALDKMQQLNDFLIELENRTKQTYSTEGLNKEPINDPLGLFK